MGGEYTQDIVDTIISHYKRLRLYTNKQNAHNLYIYDRDLTQRNKECLIMKRKNIENKGAI